MSHFKTTLLLLSIFLLSGCGAFEGLTSRNSFFTYETLESQIESESIADRLGDETDGTDTGATDIEDDSTTTTEDDTPKAPGTPITVVREDDSNTPKAPAPPYSVINPVEDLELSMTTLKKCQAGEIDVIRLAMNCRKRSPLILTLKDSEKEVLVENFGSGQLGVEQAINKLKNLKMDKEVTGYSFDLFLCLDSDMDGSCTDERLMDLNDMNADLLFSVLVFHKTKMGQVTPAQTKRLGQICNNKIMKRLNDGLVIFHQRFEDNTEEVDVAKVNVHGLTANEMAKYVKNFSSQSEVVGFETGTAVNFKLVEADRETCNGIDVRIHGCFIEGTEIQISKENSLPIEDLQVGYPVLRSNGTTSKIKKIVSGPEKKPVLEVKLASGEQVTLTETHPVWTEEGLFVASDLKEGTKLLTQKGEWSAISSISKKEYKGLVYNVELEGPKDQDHLLLSNHIVTGDLYLQNQLQEKKKVKPALSLNK